MGCLAEFSPQNLVYIWLQAGKYPARFWRWVVCRAGEGFASSALPMAIRAKDLQLACLSSVVPLSVCLFLSVFLLIAVYSHRSSIVASLPPRSKAPAQPSRAPWLSPRHLGETETTIETAIDRHEERKIEGAFVLFMFIYKKDTPN